MGVSLSSGIMPVVRNFLADMSGQETALSFASLIREAVFV